MAELFYARISKVNYKNGTADVVIEEHENQVVSDIPFLANVYEMPKIKDRVAVLIEYIRGDVDKGVILGPVYSNEKKPNRTGKSIFEKRFKDGTSITYNEELKLMTVEAERLKVKELNAERVVANSAKVGTLDTSGCTYKGA